MEKMLIEDIIKSDEDTEIKKYQVLSAIKNHSERLRKNQLYPSLTELVNSMVKLEHLINKAVVNLPEDQEDKALFNEGFLLSELEVVEEEEDETTELINWTMYHVNKILDEGIALFEFAEKEIKIGLISGEYSNRNEGYFIIPNLVEKTANIYRFETITFNNASEPLTSIKTKHLISYTEQELLSKTTEPAIKVLMDYINDKGAVVFFCSTDVELPYEETVLPVAKKNLLKFLAE